MDERLEGLIRGGADITIKLRKQNTFIQVRFEKDTYKASAGTFEKALDRVCESIHNKTKNIKAKRREKEHLRQDIYESIQEAEEIEWEVSHGF